MKTKDAPAIDDFAAALNLFVSIHTVQSKERKGKGGLNTNAKNALELLKAKGGLTAGQIVEILGWQNAQMTRTRHVLELYDPALIECKKNRGDKRVVDVEITDTGIEKLVTLNDKGMRGIQNELKHISPEANAIAATTKLVRALIQSLSKELKLPNDEFLMFDSSEELPGALQELTIVYALQNKKIAENDLGDAHRSVLELLEANGTMIVGDMAKILSLLPAQMSRVIRALEEHTSHKLINCTINPRDKRKIDVEITSAGEKVLESLRKKEVERFSAGVGGVVDITDEDCERSIHLIRQLVTAITTRKAA